MFRVLLSCLPNNKRTQCYKVTRINTDTPVVYGKYPDFCPDFARIFAKKTPGFRPDFYKNELGWRISNNGKAVPKNWLAWSVHLFPWHRIAGSQGRCQEDIWVSQVLGDVLLLPLLSLCAERQVSLLKWGPNCSSGVKKCGLWRLYCRKRCPTTW